MKTDPSSKIFTLIISSFAVVGLGLLTGGFLSFRNTQAFFHAAISTTGSVIGNDRHIDSERNITYYPTVQFRTNSGRLIEFASNSGSSKYSAIGSKVPVLYDPTHPQEARINSFFSLWGATLVLSILGGTFSTVTIAILFSFRCFKSEQSQQEQQSTDQEWLQTHGTRIMTDFKRVGTDDFWQENGVAPYKIFTQWYDRQTHEVHVFESELLWFDPSDFIQGQPICVYVDPADSSRYYMDTSFLPKLHDEIAAEPLFI